MSDIPAGDGKMANRFLKLQCVTECCTPLTKTACLGGPGLAEFCLGIH